MYDTPGACTCRGALEAMCLPLMKPSAYTHDLYGLDLSRTFGVYAGPDDEA